MDNDPVNNPKHYNSHPSGIETIEISERLNFTLGNAFKYLARYKHKNNPVEDLKKAIWYLQRNEVENVYTNAETQLITMYLIHEPELESRLMFKTFIDLVNASSDDNKGEISTYTATLVQMIEKKIKELESK